MNNLLKDKKIVVGVTGSISIYKSLEIIRLFIKAGAKVRVIMSESAKEFISPITFEAISQNIVLHKDTQNWQNDNNHIGLAKWADILLIAPASANTINKISAGIADNLLLETVLAYNKTIIIAPSANTKMYLNPNTQASLKKLKVFGHIVVNPEKKVLACKDEGVGALANPLEIFYQSSRELLKEDFWINRRIVITGGGTIEKIDDIRYISNFSSGKMAYSLALALYLKGSDVCFISTKEVENLPKNIYNIIASDSKKLQKTTENAIEVAKKGIMSKPNVYNKEAPKLIKKKPYLFMVAAVSDFIPKNSTQGKLKKEIIGKTFSLELMQNTDILKEIDKNGIYSIGFKAETDEENALQSAKNMLENKHLNGVCLNIIGKNTNFGSDENEIDFITKDKIKRIKKNSKLNVSFKILDFAKELETFL